MEPNEQSTIGPTQMQSPARRSMLQHTELMPQHQDLGFQLLSRLEVVAQHADETGGRLPSCGDRVLIRRRGFRKRQVLYLKPAPRLEQVCDKRANQLDDGKHRAG